MTYEQIMALRFLNVSGDADEMEIKRAYAKRLKTCNPETDPQAWILLHDAYEKALSSLENRKDLYFDYDDEDDDDDEELLNQFEEAESESESESGSEYDSFFQEIESMSSESEAKNEPGYILVNLNRNVTLKMNYSVKPDETVSITGVEIQKARKSLSSERFVFEIPEYINGYPVTEIGASSFSSCHILKEIIIPEGVANICTFAFSDCVNLERVILPGSLFIIESKAFEGCDSLKEIRIPEGTSEIGDKAFAGCIFLENVHIPSTVKFIGFNAFLDCVLIRVFIMRRNPYAEEYCRRHDITFTVPSSEGCFCRWVKGNVPVMIMHSEEIYRPESESLREERLNVSHIGKGFDLTDVQNCFEKAYDIRRYAYVFRDKIFGVEFEIIDDGRKRLGLTDSMLAKKLLAVSPLVPKKIKIEHELDVYKNMIWCGYSFRVNSPGKSSAKFFGGLIVCNSYVLHVTSSNKHFHDVPLVGGIYHLIKSLLPVI